MKIEVKVSINQEKLNKYISDIVGESSRCDISMKDNIVKVITDTSEFEFDIMNFVETSDKVLTEE